MNVEIYGIFDRGDSEKERVHLRVKADTVLNNYALFDTNYVKPGMIGAGNKSAYWFEPRKVESGLNVVLYTRRGAMSEETRLDGSKYLFLFRGMDGPLYAEPAATTVLWELQFWETARL